MNTNRIHRRKSTFKEISIKYAKHTPLRHTQTFSNIVESMICIDKLKKLGFKIPRNTDKYICEINLKLNDIIKNYDGIYIKDINIDDKEESFNFLKDFLKDNGVELILNKKMKMLLSKSNKYNDTETKIIHYKTGVISPIKTGSRSNSISESIKRASTIKMGSNSQISAGNSTVLGKLKRILTSHKKIN